MEVQRNQIDVTILGSKTLNMDRYRNKEVVWRFKFG